LTPKTATPQLILKWQTDTWLKQHAGTELLMAKGERLTCIHEHLLRVHSEAAVDVNVV
jgi:hypothetical protein